MYSVCIHNAYIMHLWYIHVHDLEHNVVVPYPLRMISNIPSRPIVRHLSTQPPGLTNFSKALLKANQEEHFLVNRKISMGRDTNKCQWKKRMNREKERKEIAERKGIRRKWRRVKYAMGGKDWGLMGVNVYHYLGTGIGFQWSCFLNPENSDNKTILLWHQQREKRQSPISLVPCGCWKLQKTNRLRRQTRGVGMKITGCNLLFFEKKTMV